MSIWSCSTSAFSSFVISETAATCMLSETEFTRTAVLAAVVISLIFFPSSSTCPHTMIIKPEDTKELVYHTVMIDWCCFCMYCFLSGSYQKTYFETKPSCLGMQHSFAMAALRIDIGFGGPYYCFTVCQHTPQASVLFGMCLLLSCDIVMLSCSASPMLTCKQSNSFAMLALLMIFEKFLRAALGILGQGIPNILATPAPLLTRINNGDRDMALMARYIKGALASSRILSFGLSILMGYVGPSPHTGLPITSATKYKYTGFSKSLDENHDFMSVWTDATVRWAFPISAQNPLGFFFWLSDVISAGSSSSWNPFSTSSA